MGKKRRKPNDKTGGRVSRANADDVIVVIFEAVVPKRSATDHAVWCESSVTVVLVK